VGSRDRVARGCLFAAAANADDQAHQYASTKKCKIHERNGSMKTPIPHREETEIDGGTVLDAQEEERNEHGRRDRDFEKPFRIHAISFSTANANEARFALARSEELSSRAPAVMKADSPCERAVQFGV